MNPINLKICFSLIYCPLWSVTIRQYANIVDLQAISSVWPDRDNIYQLLLSDVFLLRWFFFYSALSHSSCCYKFRWWTVSIFQMSCSQSFLSNCLRNRARSLALGWTRHKVAAPGQPGAATGPVAFPDWLLQHRCIRMVAEMSRVWEWHGLSG